MLMSGFTLDASTNQVLTFAGAKYVYQVTGDDRTMITVMASVSAKGAYIPPMMIYPPKTS